MSLLGVHPFSAVTGEEEKEEKSVLVIHNNRGTRPLVLWTGTGWGYRPTKYFREEQPGA